MVTMKIDRIILRLISLPLVRPFETSFGTTRIKRAVLVEVCADGLSGWGECVAGEGPFYSYEDVYTAWEVLRRWILPRVAGRSLESPSQFLRDTAGIRGHQMAKAAVEAALWDLKARVEGKPLWRLLGGTRRRIACGVSIGIQPDTKQLLLRVEEALGAGYHRIKVKIKPGLDIVPLEEIRKRFPAVPLMADANSAYTPADVELLRSLDAFELMMIEQPLFDDDLVAHSRLQPLLRTPICLDESITHARAAEHALDLGAARIINLKFGRVGGLEEARRIHDLCQARGVPVWCGGMLETGIGRAHNVALSTLANFSLPGDVSASARYFQRDTVLPPVEVSSDGCIDVPETAGIGYEPDRDWIERITEAVLSMPEA